MHPPFFSLKQRNEMYSSQQQTKQDETAVVDVMGRPSIQNRFAFCQCIAGLSLSASCLSNV